MQKRMRIFAAAITLVARGGIVVPAAAETYPSRPITMSFFLLFCGGRAGRYDRSYLGAQSISI
jgi:hypothetical protein